MRLRHVMAALTPVGAASALAVLPFGSAVASSAAAVAGHMTSAVAAPHAYAYVNNGLLVAWSDGDPTQVGTFYLFGGTSAGSPQWAAITALADQQDGHPVGYLNDKLYSLAHGPQYNSVFHDITSGNNTVSLADSNGNAVNVAGFAAVKGWDPVTGLGTPNVAHLLQYLK